MSKENYNIVVLLAIGVLALVLCIWGITARINGLQERVSNDEGVIERLNMGLSRVEGQLDTLITAPPSTDDDSYYGFHDVPVPHCIGHGTVIDGVCK